MLTGSHHCSLAGGKPCWVGGSWTGEGSRGSYARSNVAAVAAVGGGGGVAGGGCVAVDGVDGVGGDGVLGSSCGEQARGLWWWCLEVCMRGGPEARSMSGRRWAQCRSAWVRGSGAREAAGQAGSAGPGGSERGWDWSRTVCRGRWTSAGGEAGGGGDQPEAWQEGRD